MKNSDGRFSEKLFALSKHKQYLPYEMITSVRDLHCQTLCQKDFTSTLGIGSHMTSEQFSEFQTCWQTLRSEKYGEDMTLKDYLCFYNALDVLLLCEVHLSFRKLLFENYRISPDFYPTLPSFCYEAFLRMLQLGGGKVELIHDEEMSNFVLRAKRGGLTQILGMQQFIGSSIEYINTIHISGPRLHGAPGSEDLMNLLKPSFLRYARDGGILPESDGEDQEAADGGSRPSMLDAEACMQEGGFFPSALSSAEVGELSEGCGWRLLYIDANNCKHHCNVAFFLLIFFQCTGRQ